MKLKWCGDRPVTDSVIHYIWEPGQVHDVDAAIAEILLTNSSFAVDGVETPDEILENESLDIESEL